MDIDLEMQDAKPPPPAPSHSILIVEDDAPDMALVTRKVRTLWPDCRIVPVKSLKQAHDEYQKQAFDMVFLDLNLPDGIGPQTVSDIRKMDAKVPIIVITGMVSSPTTSESLKRGASLVVPKAEVMYHNFLNLMKTKDK